jgi:hypothetical protein
MERLPTLRVTPAVAAGVTDRLWDLEDMAALLEKQAPAKRGPYKKRGCLDGFSTGFESGSGRI